MSKDLRLPDGRDRIVCHGHGRIAQITAGRDAAQTALTAGALKRSADRLLRHSTSAEVYRD